MVYTKLGKLKNENKKVRRANLPVNDVRIMDDEMKMRLKKFKPSMGR